MRLGRVLSVMSLALLSCGTDVGVFGGGAPNGAGGAAGAGGNAMVSGTGGAGQTGGTTTSGTTTSGTTTAATTSSGMPCEEQPCKLVSPQCGCAGAERCTLKADARVCVPEGNSQPGYECKDDCTAGYFCAGNDTGAPETCHAFCEVDADCEYPGGKCVLKVGASAKLCTESCNPITGMGCLVTGKTKCDVALAPQVGAFTICGGAGTKKQGQSCAKTNDCAPGSTCVTINATNTCAAWCEVSNPICPGNSMCASIGNGYIVGNIEYGACVNL